MKIDLYDENGEKKGDISLPGFFDKDIREDIVAKSYEAEKFILRQVYSPFKEAGRRHSASGIVRHSRHKWKGHYGKGISRVPRKIMWRRGGQFFWIGAEVSQTRGGRAIHAPKGVYRMRKINKKEISKAIESGLASTVNKKFVSIRYPKFNEKIKSIVVESIPSKMKEMLSLLKKIYEENYVKLIKFKEIRAGKGKRRGRKYKSNAGILIVISNKENNRFKGIDVRKVGDIKIRDIYPLGRITIYTKKALEELENAA